MFHRHQILASAGLKVDDFGNQKEAFATAEEFAIANAKEYEFEHEKIDHANPLLVNFKFVITTGTKRSWKSIDQTEVRGHYGAQV